ncbi:MAG: hypothetical protein ACREX0_07375 [Noviherbaspirillum sp.]
MLQIKTQQISFRRVSSGHLKRDLHGTALCHCRPDLRFYRCGIYNGGDDLNVQKKSPQTLRLRANPIQEELEETGRIVLRRNKCVCFIVVITDIRNIYFFSAQQKTRAVFTARARVSFDPEVDFLVWSNTTRLF